MDTNNNFNIQRLFELVLGFDFKSITIQNMKEFVTKDRKNACN